MHDAIYKANNLVETHTHSLWLTCLAPQFMSAKMPLGPTVLTIDGDTMAVIRRRLYPEFLKVHVSKWEETFISINKVWIITPESTFEGGALLHMPNVDSSGVFRLPIAPFLQHGGVAIGDTDQHPPATR